MRRHGARITKSKLLALRRHCDYQRQLEACSPTTHMRKRNNPDWDSSSFYVPRRVNIAFDKAILEMKLQGHELDRSDVLSWLMNQWAAAPYPVPSFADDQSDATVEV